MAIAFDQEKAFTYIYHYTNGAYDTTNYADSTAFDLFSDTAQVGDYILFGRHNPDWSFHDLKFNIGTALSATSITVVWEHLEKYGTWTAIPSVTDGTNAFQNTGINTVAFDVPQNMCCGSTYWRCSINIDGNKYANWVRARIVAINGVTEGGRTQTDTVKFKDFTITCTDEALTLASLQSASDSGNWLARTGVKAVETTGRHTIIRPHMLWTGTTGFSETMKTIELGEDNYPAGFRHLGSGILKLGIEDASGKGDEGCYLYMHARLDTGSDYVNNLQAYASVIRRRTGFYGAFAMKGVFKFVDSVFISDSRWYLSALVASGSEWTRSLYADPDILYLFSPNLAINTFKWLDASQGIASGGNAIISNTDIANKKIMRFYNADIDLIDCINIDHAQITTAAPMGGDHYVRVKYNIDLHIIDKDNNPISNASVKIDDVDGTNVVDTTTDASGKISTQTITAYQKWWVEAEGYAMHEKDFNDFTLTISKTGYKTKKVKYTMGQKRVEVETLENRREV